MSLISRITMRVPEHTASTICDNGNECHWFRIRQGHKSRFSYQDKAGITMSVEYDFTKNIKIDVNVPKLRLIPVDVLRIYVQEDYNKLNKPIHEYTFDKSDLIMPSQHIIEMDHAEDIQFLGIYLGDKVTRSFVISEYN